MKNYWLDQKKITLEECEKFRNQLMGTLKWDFQTALADTIREKYESKYVKVIAVNSIHARKIR